MIAFALGEGLSQLMGMEHIRMCAQATCTQCQQEESSSWNLQLNAVLAAKVTQESLQSKSGKQITIIGVWVLAKITDFQDDHHHKQCIMK